MRNNFARLSSFDFESVGIFHVLSTPLVRTIARAPLAPVFEFGEQQALMAKGFLYFKVCEISAKFRVARRK